MKSKNKWTIKFVPNKIAYDGCIEINIVPKIRFKFNKPYGGNSFKIAFLLWALEIEQPINWKKYEDFQEEGKKEENKNNSKYHNFLHLSSSFGQ